MEEGADVRSKSGHWSSVEGEGARLGSPIYQEEAPVTNKKKVVDGYKETIMARGNTTILLLPCVILGLL